MNQSYLLFFISLLEKYRRFSFKNPYHCIILSIIVTLLAPLVSRYIPINIYFSVLIIVINFILFFVFVPVDCEEKRLSNSEKNFYKRLSLIILVIYSFFLLLFYVTNMQFLFQLICFIELISALSICLSGFKNFSYTYIMNDSFEFLDRLF